MEYMDGGNLDARLDSNPDGLALPEALWVGERLRKGIGLAHNYGIAHLDLEPANVLFRKTKGDTWDVPKVADWGLARVLAEETGTMEVLSVEFAAPEQFEPDEFGDPDMLTDVYQAGAIVYALLTGRPPYTGSQLSVMKDIVDEDLPTAPSDHRPELDTAVDEVVLAALEQRKGDRYQGIHYFGDALEALRRDGQLPPIVQQRMGEDADGTPTTTSETEDVAPGRSGGSNRSSESETETAVSSARTAGSEPSDGGEGQDGEPLAAVDGLGPLMRASERSKDSYCPTTQRGGP
jgi:serine/threonine protein kinase